MQRLWASVALTALDDAIVEQRNHGNGDVIIRRWANSKDGREVLSLAGIDSGPRTTDLMVGFVKRGVRPSMALTVKSKVESDE